MVDWVWVREGGREGQRRGGARYYRYSAGHAKPSRTLTYQASTTHHGAPRELSYSTPSVSGVLVVNLPSEIL